MEKISIEDLAIGLITMAVVIALAVLAVTMSVTTLAIQAMLEHCLPNF